MINYFLKIVITTALIVSISEISKRSTLIAALVASLPLTSIMAITWLYLDTKDSSKVIELSTSIFWLVLPSLVFFIFFPWLLKHGLNFIPAMLISISATGGSYWVMITILNRYGIKF